MAKKIYYAHGVYLYGTRQENRDLHQIERMFPNRELYNPNNPEAKKAYSSLVGCMKMRYFYDIIISSCNILIFRSTPYGRIPAGVAAEIKTADDCGIPIIELPSVLNRTMSIEETGQYLYEIGNR